MNKNGLLILIILLLGMLIGVVLHDAVQITPTESSDATKHSLSPSETDFSSRDTSVNRLTLDPEDYDDLRVLLEDADLVNQQQEQRISDLHTRIQSLEDKMGKNPSSARVEQSHGTGMAARNTTSEITGVDSLIAAGIDSQTANWIQQQLDQNEMEKLYLKNTALREGWINKKRYRKSLRELQGRFDALRDDIGDENFDRLLFAVGRRNRVFIRSTMNGSPSELFGLNRGDTIIRYDDKRIFSAAELQRKTSRGDPESMVSIEVLRNGSPMTLYVPGGPLGIKLKTRRTKP